MGMLNENVHSKSFVADFITRSSSLKNFDKIESESMSKEIRTKPFDTKKFNRGSTRFTKWLGKEIIKKNQ